ISKRDWSSDVCSSDLLLSISTLGLPLWVGSSETTPEEISALPPNRTAIPTAAATQSRQQTAMRTILFVLSVMVYASLVYFLLMGQYHIFLWKSIEKTGWIRREAHIWPPCAKSCWRRAKDSPETGRAPPDGSPPVRYSPRSGRNRGCYFPEPRTGRRWYIPPRRPRFSDTRPLYFPDRAFQRAGHTHRRCQCSHPSGLYRPDTSLRRIPHGRRGTHRHSCH